MYLRSIPAPRVRQFHLAGHTDLGTHCIDTHDGRVVDRVWELYREAVELTGGAATLLEWDARIPSFDEVHQEALKAKEFLGGVRQPATNNASRITPPVSIAVPHPAHFIAAEAE
jgi:uncharacterized protein (UPF0276 family)